MARSVLNPKPQVRGLIANSQLQMFMDWAWVRFYLYTAFTLTMDSETSASALPFSTSVVENSSLQI
jgi:hypothetical protein